MENKDKTDIINGDDTIHYMLLPSHSVDSTNTSASSSLQCSYADGRAIHGMRRQAQAHVVDSELDSGPDKFTFVHFYKCPNLCAEFAQYIQGLQYEVGHICCNGEGCRIVNADYETAENLKQLFVQKLHEAGYHYEEYHYEDSSS